MAQGPPLSTRAIAPTSSSSTRGSTLQWQSRQQKLWLTSPYQAAASQMIPSSSQPCFHTPLRRCEYSLNFEGSLSLPLSCNIFFLFNFSWKRNCAEIDEKITELSDFNGGSMVRSDPTNWTLPIPGSVNQHKCEQGELDCCGRHTEKKHSMFVTVSIFHFQNN